MTEAANEKTYQKVVAEAKQKQMGTDESSADSSSDSSKQREEVKKFAEKEEPNVWVQNAM